MKTPEISLIVTGSGRTVSSFGWTRFALAALATAGPVMAADVTSMWTSPASGNWNAGANWTNVPLAGGFPNNGNGGVATYDATINAVGGNYTVTLGTDVTIEDLLLNSGNATLSHTTGQSGHHQRRPHRPDPHHFHQHLHQYRDRPGGRDQRRPADRQWHLEQYGRHRDHR